MHKKTSVQETSVSKTMVNPRSTSEPVLRVPKSPSLRFDTNLMLRTLLVIRDPGWKNPFQYLSLILEDNNYKIYGNLNVTSL